MSPILGVTRGKVALVGLIAVAAVAAPLIASSAGSQPRVRHSAEAATVTFSPRSSLARLDLRSGEVRPVAVGDFFSVAAPSLSPSGQVAFTASSCATCTQRLAIARGSHAATSYPATSVTWMNDGQLLTVAGRGEDTDVWLVNPHGRRHEIEWLSHAAEGLDIENQRALAISPNGRTLLFSGEGRSEHHGNYIADLRGHRLLPLAGESDDAPASSPDGRTIIFQHVSRGGEWDVCVARIAPRRAAPRAHCYPSPAANDRQPAFLPNGRQIVFSSDRASPRTGASSLYVLDLGTGSIRRLTPAGYDAASPASARDGRSVIFVRRALVPLR
jgi:Tol biopolymer transport system component